MPERKPLRIVHTSDVHLGAYAGSGDAKWNARRELMELTFERVIDLANETNADALLIAGDFFDNDRVPEETVIFAAETIRRFRGQTFVIPGNHDPMDPGSIYWRHDMESIARRLTIVRGHKGELVEPEGLDLVLWGRAYLDTDWHFRPLEGLPERVDDRRCDDGTDARASITARRNRVNAACSRVVFCRQYATEDSSRAVVIVAAVSIAPETCGPRATAGRGSRSIPMRAVAI